MAVSELMSCPRQSGGYARSKVEQQGTHPSFWSMALKQSYPHILFGTRLEFNSTMKARYMKHDEQNSIALKKSKNQPCFSWLIICKVCAGITINTFSPAHFKSEILFSVASKTPPGDIRFLVPRRVLSLLPRLPARDRLSSLLKTATRFPTLGTLSSYTDFMLKNLF